MMSYTINIRHIDDPPTVIDTVLRAKNKDEVIYGLMDVLQRAGFFANPQDSDYF